MLAAIRELKADIGVRAACAALEFPRATWHRRKRPAAPKPKSWRPPNSWSLTPEERRGFLEVAHCADFIDKAPPQIYYTLLDTGCYMCSIRTMYRILAAAGEVKERRDQLRHPTYKRPELLATGPNQLWSWDITKLRGPAKGHYYQLYVVLDVYSRYVVGWLLATHESDDLAQQLLRATHEKQGIQPGELTVHADRGAAMTSAGVAGLLERLDVRKSHSRPGVSDDNPYSESQFKTMKYRPDYPDRFGSREDALAFCRPFFDWYNEENYHSGICWLTPASVHYGQAESILTTRHQTLISFYNHDPKRFRKGPPKLHQLPASVWINRPFSLAHGATLERGPFAGPV